MPPLLLAGRLLRPLPRQVAAAGPAAQPGALLRLLAAPLLHLAPQEMGREGWCESLGACTLAR